MTDIVCESWVLPQRNSPKTSLMLMVWKPLHSVSHIASDDTVNDHSPSEHRVELLASGRDLEHALALLTELMRSLEAAASRLQGVSRCSYALGDETLTWHLAMASLTLSTLISLKPLIFNRLRRVAEWTEAMV